MRISRPTTILVSGSLLLSFIAVVFLWEFWESGPYALGVNMSVFLALAPLVYAYASGKRLTRVQFTWLVPFLLIALGYLLYENPFLKITSLPVLPVLFALIWLAAATDKYESVYWDFAWLQNLVRRFFGVVPRLGQAATDTLDVVLPFGERKAELTRRILLGLGIFLAVSLFLIVPLLSAAEPAFAAIVESFLQWVAELISIETVVRIFFFAFFATLLVAGFLRWTAKEQFTDKGAAKHLDPIVSGIVLAGVLLLYVVFLWTQLSALWVASLPVEFESTEHLVKSGFWQLVFLSGINVLFFLSYYRRTSLPVQRILIAFTLASFLLLLSALQRMVMYVWYYGFSYEKFFALYTVVFAVLLFIRLVAALFARERADILRYVVTSFAWMYAIAMILPIEQFIFRANVALSQREDSRIVMTELMMLSSDVYTLVEAEHAARPNIEWDRWLGSADSTHASKELHEWTARDVWLHFHGGQPELPADAAVRAE